MISIRRGACGSQDAVKAARHICEEARVVLTSLRGGHPAVSRGELAQDLMELRILAKAHLDAPSDGSLPISIKTTRPSTAEQPEHEDQSSNYPSPQHQQQQDSEEDDGLEGAVLVQRGDAQAFIPPESPIPTSKLCNITVPGTARIKEVSPDKRSMRGEKPSPENVGPFVHPFLAVVMDPRAAGPHTLVALRALFRLLEMGSLVQPSEANHGFHVLFEPLMRGVLACKFEQTDAGADEAVEMAIADLVALLVNLDHSSIPSETLMEAFNTVFVTRNTFVHSPALCYHFEDVLSSMVVAIFRDLDSSDEEAPRLILEFLVNQLLHTPLVGGDVVDSSALEAQIAHDATRVLCLRLVQCCLRTGWGDTRATIDMPRMPLAPVEEAHSDNSQDEDDKSHHWEERSLLRIVQDDLCLSLLMTGQAIWAYHDAQSNISPGVISLEVLSEICATLSTLWNTTVLRKQLVSQFETIFTGFYQRALALLRRRRNPTDSEAFNRNLVFDAEVEVILESLVDLLCLHNHDSSQLGGHDALESLFSAYDCHMNRSDVAFGLVLELCRCCGGSVDEEGEPLIDVSSHSGSAAGTGTNTPVSGGTSVSGISGMLPSEAWRPVPAHLKELCVEALLGAMKCLFRDRQSDVTPLARRLRVLSDEVDLEGGLNGIRPENDTVTSTSLRNEKSKKRLMRKATALFNSKSTEGIQFLASSGLVPTPVTPVSVASFLRNGIVVGLDKKAVGAYLGEIGKSPVAGKSPPSWERDWFHKDVLNEYCSLFRFERQSLLEGLRMFLASFRLPGEAQQIDRILQAFSDSCGRTCDESSQGRLKLFSPDPKKASDAAYLLSFSIIMLNTDQHNDNIREDRKMKMADFVRNNADYGEDITDPGHELPREFLEGIYESIREEEIRTEGEGADGHMTVERWKDVLRGPAGDSDESESTIDATATDADDVKELLIENLWMPILSTIGALWGVVNTEEPGVEGEQHAHTSTDISHSGMLGAQGARLGMDMALETLTGIQKFGRMDLFRSFFVSICGFSGLLTSYATDAVDRTWSFVNSVEAQSAVIVAIHVAKDAGADIGMEGWKCIWGMIFELRDLKLLVGGSSTEKGILAESDPDLLNTNARREWTMRVIKGGWDDDGANKRSRAQKKGLFAALFGSQEDSTESHGFNVANSTSSKAVNMVHTQHGKEELVIWDELAPSDDEDEVGAGNFHDEHDFDATNFGEVGHYSAAPYGSSVGAAFESQLIHEDILVYHQEITPVTGLERAEDTNQYHISPRARVRKRLARTCDFAGLVSESRFMDLEGIRCLLMALIDMVQSQSDRTKSPEDDGTVPISPASEALAEILICEIALKNRDRLGMLWRTILHDHYARRLGGQSQTDPDSNQSRSEKTSAPSPGLEKCVTGLFRICCCAVLREDVANDVISSLKLFSRTEDGHIHVLQHLQKHVGEGLWRICRNTEGLKHLDSDGWEGIIGIAEWCAWRDCDTMHAPPGLAEDDPALQAFRSLHLVLHSPDLQDVIPLTVRVVATIRALILAGEKRHCPKLSIAGLDLLQLVHVRVESLVAQASANKAHENDAGEIGHWIACWIPVLEGLAEAAEHSTHMSVREHALSLITDAFIDKHGRTIPAEQLCEILHRICIPLAGKRLARMFGPEEAKKSSSEEILTEFELCIGLLFKPLLHHLKNIIGADADITSAWKPILVIMEQLFCAEEGVEGIGTSHDSQAFRGTNEAKTKVLLAAQELACEHLRNAVMVLLASGVLDCEKDTGISGLTWTSLQTMKLENDVIAEWKRSAMGSPDKPPTVATEVQSADIADK